MIELEREKDLNREHRSAPAHLPDLYMPAMPPLELISALQKRYRAWQRRRIFRHLLDYDDRVLEDLGYARHDLLWALRLPLKTDAFEALRSRRQCRAVPLRFAHGTVAARPDVVAGRSIAETPCRRLPCGVRMGQACGALRMTGTASRSTAQHHPAGNKARRTLSGGR